MKDKRILALGFFDGVHLGHQVLLKACVDLARQLNMRPAAITFDRHPQALFHHSPPQINSAEDRETLLRHYGMEEVFVLPVVQSVMQTPWQEFLLEQIKNGAAGFVCGEDFRFGNRGEGNARLLAEFCRERNLPCVIVPDQLLGGVRISSTHIRQLLEQGEMVRAMEFLGHPHILSGVVIPGKQLGRTIGIPTANIRIPEGILVPKFGVYACRVVTETGEFSAVTNIGSRPTVAGSGITVEPWILDFDGNLYGKTIELQFYHFLRPEKKFASLEELQEEIRKNAAEVRIFFKK